MVKKCFFSFFVIFIFTVSSIAASDETESEEKKFPPQAILFAAYQGNIDLILEILADDPDRNVRDALGSTALHLATLQPNPAVVKLLLDNGFDPNARATRNGNTPLHNAVAANNPDAARVLLSYQADKNIRNLDGQTPYEKAVREEKRPLVLLLLR